MNIKFGVDTTVIGNEIRQEFYKEHENVRTTIMRQVMDVAERDVRNALIKLGWTPPPERGQDELG